MRELKARAWYYKSSTWIYFDLTKGFATDHQYEIYKDVLLSGSKWFEYTGLKDKNGKEIYEGDILKNTKDDKLFNWQVEWSNKYAGFVIVNIGIDGYKGDRFPINSEYYFEDREIIGNIHENPELLK